MGTTRAMIAYQECTMLLTVKVYTAVNG